MHQPRPHAAYFYTPALIALGGAAGSVARWFLGKALGSVMGLFAVNVIGCVLIGLLYGRIDAHPTCPTWLKPLFGTGFLGGFTTFSSAILLTADTITIGHWPLVYSLVLGQPLACVLGVGLGNQIARFWVTPRGVSV